MKQTTKMLFTGFITLLFAGELLCQEGQTVRQQELEKAKDREGSLVLSIAAMVNNKVENFEQDKFRNGLGVGGGVLVEANIQDWFGIETGALLTNTQYDWGDKGFRVVQEVMRLHVPVLARFWITDYLSFGAGPYASFKVGDTRTTAEVGPFRARFDSAADDDVTLGADLAATFNIAVADKTGFFIEGRYSQPFQEKGNEKINQLAGLAGVKIDL